VFQEVKHPPKKFSGKGESLQNQRLDLVGCHLHKGQRMRLKSVTSICFSEIFSMISSGVKDLRNNAKKLLTNGYWLIDVDIFKK
jgi:hypothetical protein